MRVILFFILFIGIVFGPQLWVWWVFRQYRQEREDFPGTGGELARHLLNRFGLQHVRVEPTPLGDHYNPETKLVGLSPQHYTGKSLTAAVVAAHEVGHALQDYEGYKLLKDRAELVRVAQKAEKVGSYLMLGLPIVAMPSRRAAQFAFKPWSGGRAAHGSPIRSLVDDRRPLRFAARIPLVMIVARVASKHFQVDWLSRKRR